MVILFNRSDGREAKHDHGIRVFEIPQSGVLLTQEKPQIGAALPPGSVQFYYVDSSGNRSEFPEISASGTVHPSDETCVYAHVAYGEAGVNGVKQLYESYFIVRAGDNIDSTEHALQKGYIRQLSTRETAIADHKELPDHDFKFAP